MRRQGVRRALDGHLLTILGEGGPVVPRRVRVTLARGSGRLVLPASLATDEAWRASVGAAWAAARRLAERDDADARVEVVAGAPLRGASAGLPVGLLALGELLDAGALAPHFATGGVLDADGYLAGGLASSAKAEAAAVFGPQLGLAGAPLLTPPVEPEAASVAPATDLASAFARVAPDAYARIAARHRALRRDADPAPRFARVAERAGARLLEVGGGGLLWWRAPLAPGAEPEAELARAWALAERYALR